MLDITSNCRFYFCDLGVADYFLNMAGAPPDMIAGIVNENFVYLYLKRKIDNQEIAGLTPMFERKWQYYSYKEIENSVEK